MRTLILILCLAGTSCASVGPAVNITASKAFVPPPEYHTSWDEALACVGSEVLPGSSFDRVEWRTAKEIKTIPFDHDLAGLWVPPHTIYIVQDFLNDPRVVFHEILHELLGRDRGHKHPTFRKCDPLN